MFYSGFCTIFKKLLDFGKRWFDLARVLDKQKAYELRKLGKSYSEIKAELGISKSTLSGWLWEYPLTKEQIDSLRGKNPRRIERFRETMRLKREKRFREIYLSEQKSLLPLSRKEVLIAGLFLYWGEGSKLLNGSSRLNNTDPQVLKFTLYWFVKALEIPREKITVSLHLYSDMIVDDEIDFWSKKLNLPKIQFAKPYIKESKRIGITQKGFGHGTCGLNVNGSRLKERIVFGIKAIADYYSLKI